MDVLNPIIWVRPIKCGSLLHLMGLQYKVWLTYAVEYDRRDVRMCEEVKDYSEWFYTKEEAQQHIEFINSRIVTGDAMVIGDECLEGD